MSKKPGKKSAAKPTHQTMTPDWEILRLFSKEHYKEAVRLAKMFHRDAGTAESRKLLEKAYLLRAEQLAKGGMPAAAGEVVGHLQAFGVTFPEIRAGLDQLLPKIGLADVALRISLESGDEARKTEMLGVIADRSVIDPAAAPKSHPELAAGAALVRSVLEDVLKGRETALEQLREIPRTSPFADWRLFARGLVAFNAKDIEKANAAWERLEPSRAPGRIAARLRATGKSAPGKLTQGKERTDLETARFGRPVIETLEKIRELIPKRQWADITKLIAPLNATLQDIEPDLPERLTRILLPHYSQYARKESLTLAEKYFANLSKAMRPVSYDPTWKRFWGYVWEGPQGDADGAAEFWEAYLKSVDRLPYAAGERDRIRLLVRYHIGELYVRVLPPADEFLPPSFRSEIGGVRDEAARHFEACLRLDPAYLPALLGIMHVYPSSDEPKKFVAAAERLLERFPENIEALDALIEHHHSGGRPQGALRFVVKARDLKPLDPRYASKEWKSRYFLLRDAARSSREADGLVQIEAIESRLPMIAQDYVFIAMKCVFALKFQDSEDALAPARAAAPDPLALHLACLIAADAFKLDSSHIARFESNWKTGLETKTKDKSASIGEAGRLLQKLRLLHESDCLRLREKELVEYLEGAKRARYEREDLISICSFIESSNLRTTLRESLTERGLKNFPDSVHFLLYSCESLLDGRPSPANRAKLRSRVEKALKLAASATDPAEAALEPRLKELKDEIGKRASPFPFPFSIDTAGAGFYLLDGMDDDDDDEDDDEDDEGDFDFDDGGRPYLDPFFATPRPKRAKSPKKKTPKKRK